MRLFGIKVVVQNEDIGPSAYSETFLGKVKAEHIDEIVAQVRAFSLEGLSNAVAPANGPAIDNEDG